MIATCDIFVIVSGHWHLARPSISHLIARTTNTDTHVHLVHASADPFICTELQRIALVNGARVTLHNSSMASGPAASLNECLQHAAAPYCVFIGVDVVVSQGAVHELCSALGSDAGIAIASPLAHCARYTTLPMLPGTNLARMNELIQVNRHSRSVDVPRPEHFCFAVRREVFDVVGCFDDLFESQADTIDDFAFRTQQQEYRVVCAMSAYVYRRGSYDADGTLSPARRARSACLLQRRWPAMNEADDPAAIDKLRGQLRSLKPREFLPCDRGRIDALRTDDELEILCVLPTLNAYGGVISVVNLLNELSLRGHRCTIVSLSACDSHPHISYAEPDWVEEWADIPDRYKADYDIVMATSWETVAYAAEIGKRSGRAHCMYFIQDLEDEFYDTSDERRRRVEETYAQIDTRFAKTDYLCRELAKRGYSVHRIRPGINLDLFYPRVRPETSAITILAMMRYGQSHRGYDIVLAVLEQVARRFPDVRLILFGTDDLSEANIPFSFENAGRLEPDDLPALYSRADIFLELSRHHGFGRTGIEAMACGAACVLSDSGGVRDYARHGENALIVPVTDVTAATEAVRQLVESPALRDRLVLNGFTTATSWAEAWAAEDFLNLIYRTHPAFQAWKHPNSRMPDSRSGIEQRVMIDGAEGVNSRPPSHEYTTHPETWMKPTELGRVIPLDRPTLIGFDQFINDQHRYYNECPTKGIVIEVAIEGTLRREDALKLYEMGYYATGDILEFGTNRGLSISILAGAARDAGKKGALVTMDLDGRLTEHARRSLSELDLSRHIEFMVGDADVSCQKLIDAGRKFNFAFVDHSHTYDDVVKACRRLSQLLQPGSFCLFHDYNDSREGTAGYGVYTAVAHALDKNHFEFCGIYGCCGLFRMREA